MAGPGAESSRARRGRLRGASVWTLAGALLIVLGCGSSPRPSLRVDDALVNPSPDARTRAVLEIRRTRDLSHVPDLIELLQDPDPAVRLTAGAALRDLTGHDTGYEAWAEPVERRRQVDLWRAWWSAHGRAQGAGS